MPDQLQPFIPSIRNIKIFLLGLVWVCLGGLGPACYEVWDALTNYERVDWRHVEVATMLGAGPLAVGYWRKYKALITEPPTDEAQP